MQYVYVFALLTILMGSTACNGQVKKDLPKEKDHPKLIKTLGNPRYGNVQCILQDKAGNLWFGTTENGLYKYDARLPDGQGKSFTQYVMADGLNSNSVYTLFEDNAGKIWIGTEMGLCLYDPHLSDRRGKTFAEIKIPLPKTLPPNKNELYSNKHWVFSILQAKNGKLWFATIDGIFIYDDRPPIGQGGFTPFIINDTASGFLSTNHNVERMLEDKAGNIWFGSRTDKGVYRYDGKSITKFELPELMQDGPKPKSHSWGWPQLQDRNGNIWFSNWEGAYKYDGKSFISFTKKDGLNNLTRIIEDKKGNLWFGGGDGLSRYDPNLPAGHGRSFTRFTTKDGLPNVGVWSILEDTSGNIWVGTRETGLYLFDARLPDGQGKKFITYSEYQNQPVGN